jgi:aspartate racemase
LRKLAHTFIARDGAETILIAGTDLSTVFNDNNTDFPAIDCARIHIEAIMRRLLS